MGYAVLMHPVAGWPRCWGVLSGRGPLEGVCLQDTIHGHSTFDPSANLTE